MRPWHAVTRGEYKLWTNARGTTLFTAARRTPARTIEPGHPLRKTRPDETVESQWDEEEDATKTKMTNVECNVIPINLEPHTRLCLVTQSTEIQVLGMAKKKNVLYNRLLICVALLLSAHSWRPNSRGGSYGLKLKSPFHFAKRAVLKTFSLHC